MKSRNNAVSQYRLRKIRLSKQIAQFLEEFDPYEFRDNLQTSETVADGLLRVSKDILRDLDDGRFDEIMEDLEEFGDDLVPELSETYQSIMDELEDLKDSNPKLISKNVLRIKRRK